MSAQEQRAHVDKSDQARVANDRIIERAEELRFVSRVPVLCECSDSGCTAVLLIGISEYAEVRGCSGLYLTLPGHQLDDARSEERDGYWLQQR
jgi:hypothetical protein